MKLNIEINLDDDMEELRQCLNQVINFFDKRNTKDEILINFIGYNEITFCNIFNTNGNKVGYITLTK